MSCAHDDVSALVQDYLDCGGRIAIVPCGQSGLATSALRRSAHAWLIRARLEHVPHEAMAAIRAGALTLASARAPAAWAVLARLGGWHGESEVAAALNLCRSKAREPLYLLAARGFALAQRRGRAETFRACGRAPQWRDFLRRM